MKLLLYPFNGPCPGQPG